MHHCAIWELHFFFCVLRNHHWKVCVFQLDLSTCDSGQKITLCFCKIKKIMYTHLNFFYISSIIVFYIAKPNCPKSTLSEEHQIYPKSIFHSFTKSQIVESLKTMHYTDNAKTKRPSKFLLIFHRIMFHNVGEKNLVGPSDQRYKASTEIATVGWWLHTLTPNVFGWHFETTLKK